MGLRMDDIHAPTLVSGPSSQPTQNGAVAHFSLQELISKKENMEAELSALGSVLDSHGVNMNTSLTTFDGYPRSDIDVAQIRTTRAKIIRLKNDHKALMSKLEVAVQEQFAEGKVAESPRSQETARDPTAATSRARTNAETGASASLGIEPPFAKVNTVSPNSPAAQAGMQSCDKVVRFGMVNWTNHERLAKVAQVVQQNENRPIPIIVLRESSLAQSSQPIQLQLIPRRDWGGRGLLGCHLLPL